MKGLDLDDLDRVAIRRIGNVTRRELAGGIEANRIHGSAFGAVAALLYAAMTPARADTLIRLAIDLGDQLDRASRDDDRTETAFERWIDAASDVFDKCPAHDFAEQLIMSACGIFRHMPQDDTRVDEFFDGLVELMCTLGARVSEPEPSPSGA